MVLLQILFGILIVAINIGIIILSIKNKKLQIECQELNYKIFNDNIKNDNLREAITNYKAIIKTTNRELVELETVLLLFIKNNISVYTNSNFHSTYNYYNNRFYAKVNKKPTNNKAEGIPILNFDYNKSVSLDIYKLRHLIKSNSESLVENISKAKVFKSEMITRLENKILKNYIG